MGFASGFTGGVTLTLGIAYLAVQAHQRNRQTQGELLRAQTHLLNATTAPSDARLPEILSPPSTTERAVLPRTDFIETAKDRWNHEVLRLAHLVQSRDAVEAVEEVEDAVVRGLAKAGAAAGAAVDNGVPVAAESTKGAVASLVGKAKAAVGRAQDKLSGAATKGSEVIAVEAPFLPSSAHCSSVSKAGRASWKRALRRRSMRDINPLRNRTMLSCVGYRQ
ncbi:hypothetical protein MCOR01_005762 [Pyricularia oryzae]|nr:hypothetical protein MCOR01_005762 [Pyricularia oryzae]